MLFYCLKCKNNTESKDKKGSKILSSKCTVRGSKNQDSLKSKNVVNFLIPLDLFIIW